MLCAGFFFNMNKYITTTLPYVNADPHMGHALEFVQADILTRYWELCDSKVFFNTGTDEHGLKIYQKAQEEGKGTQAYVDEYAARFKRFCDAIGMKYSKFIRTTDPHHVHAAQEIWRRCLAKGDIEKRKYKGLYCVGDEAFMKESELVNGRCPNHPNMDLIELEEENYFFLLSKYQAPLLKYLNTEGVIVPEWRRQEAIKFVEKGLEDFSISRVKEKMSWGIPVPGDESQVMYVWFDALTNYISTLGWPEDKEGNFGKYWTNGDVVQLAGKDQVRFQSIMWQAMLMSAGVKNTDKVVYHGFITSGGQKMSKSLGNVIDPLTLVDEYDADSLRFFLARHVPTFEDTDVTLERFKEAYNADLANGLGNLTARIMQLAQTHLEKPVELPNLEFPKEFAEAMDKFEITRAMEFVLGMIQTLDQKINATEPFKVIKTDPERGRQLIAELVIDLAKLLRPLEPIIPGKGHKIWLAIKDNKKPENLFPRKE